VSANPQTETAAASSGAALAPTNYGWRIHRRVYDWVLKWADSPHGAIALFLLAAFESSFFPVPPDVLLIALVMGARTKWARLAMLCTLGSVVGGLAGYWIGASLMDVVGMRIISFYDAQQQFENVKQLYELYGYWIVFAAAFTFIPYKVFTITSGVMGMDLLGFAVVSTLGRGARFFIVAALLYWFGEPMKRFIDKYFDLLSIALVAALVGGFTLLSYVR